MFGYLKKETKVITDEKVIDELLSRGVSEVIDKNSLKKDLLSGKRLRVKLGIDPTSPNIHIGRAVVLWKLKMFQDLGHQIVLIIGDFTGIIGDTSDKDSERPMLTKKDVAENLRTYFEQAGKILDMSMVEKKYNSTWLSKLNYEEIGQQADAFSLSDFIDRENIKRRLDSGKRVSLREVLYPLMQGYDSVAVESDIELGGTDQRFNLLSGRIMQERYKQRAQYILMTRLLIGIDGRKMSSSWGNTINLNDSAEDMFGKTMRIEDSHIPEYLELATTVPSEEIQKVKNNLSSNVLHPKDAKMNLAFALTFLYHGEILAQKAKKNFIETFSEGKIPENILTEKSKDGEFLVDILLRTQIIDSKSEFSRLVTANAIEIVGGEKIVSVKEVALKGKTYRVGKHRFLKVI